MLCRTVLSAKTRLSCVNGAGGMLDGSVSCGAAAQVPTQWPASACAFAAPDTLSTGDPPGRTTALVIPAVTTAVRMTADTRPAVGPSRDMMDLIDLSIPDGGDGQPRERCRAWLIRA